jgi:large subunit ribosomal protein L1
MDEKTLTKALAELKKSSKKRNFSQSIDIIFTLKDIDLKKTENQLDFFITLHHNLNRKVKICALAGPELADECQKVCDETIIQSQFPEYQDKKKAKELAKKYDFFIAQGSIMAQVAGTFGRVFGPRGKMPNPKAGAVVAAKPQIKPLYDKLQSTIRIVTKKEPTVHVMVGKEDQDEKQVIENIIYIYDQLIHHLPKEKNNINNIFIKLTMSKPIKL